MRNAFGLEIYEIKDVLMDKNVKNTIGSLFFPVLTYLGISSSKAEEIFANCLEIASIYSNSNEYEEQAYNILLDQKVTEKLPQKLLARATLIYAQVEQYLLPGNVLDYGCGDGCVGEIIAKNKEQEVSLADVYEHLHIKETGLQFKSFKQGTQTTFQDNEFSNTLVLTVLHHSNNPVESIKDVCRITKKSGRVIVIESVYGINGKELPPQEQERIQNYLMLTHEQQRKVNIFFDHFYNRILFYTKNPKNKVNVPFNFNTPQGWEKVFLENGLKQEKIVHLGLDQPTVPEYHTLHVLRKL